MQCKDLFRYVSTGAGTVRADYYLRPTVTSLYADYRNRLRPKAVVTIHFTLFKADKKMNILFDKTYTSVVRLPAKNTKNLMYGWARGLARIYAHLSRDLNGVLSD